jgi:hypothetical protein
MLNETLYLEQHPGDLITAENWNELQRKIKADIQSQITEAKEEVKKEGVNKAANSDKLENKTADQLSKEILDKAAQQAATRTGYQRLYKNLKSGETKVIKHGLKACPLVDIYQLDSFKVVCSEDGVQSIDEGVLFFLYHTSESKIRTKGATPGSKGVTVTIEDPNDPQPFRIAFADLLAYYHVKYTDTSSLDDLVNEFEKAFFADPNDKFDDGVTCHSPWFDKCCGDHRTVGELKNRGDWDDLWLKVKPRKTINNSTASSSPEHPVPAPINLDVVHFDLDTAGIMYTKDAEPGALDELPAMVLLKV